MTDRCRTAGVDHIALAVPDLEAAVAFYVDRWGLSLVQREGDRCFLATTDACYADLVLLVGAEPALDHLAFAFASADELESVLDAVVACGHPGLRPLGPPEEPGQERSAAVLDPDGNTVELVLGSNRGAGHGAGDAPPPTRGVAPRKIGHVVLGTPQRDAMEAFYRHLGFVVSDRTAQGMSFLRCNEDHHTLALATTEAPWLQHVAYDVGTVDAVMRAMAAFREAGIAPIWGPGRHGPGDNIFTYYQDPAGTIIEYYGELEIFEEFDPKLEAREWGPEHRGDTWGLAGPPPPAFFAAGPRPVPRAKSASTDRGTA